MQIEIAITKGSQRDSVKINIADDVDLSNESEFYSKFIKPALDVLLKASK
jgi:hypothetical protein